MRQMGFILNENEHKYYGNDPNTQGTLYSSSNSNSRDLPAKFEHT
jgi:hypothetical protein